LVLAKDLFQLGDYRTAALRLEQLTVEDAKNQEAWSLLAKTYMKLTETALAHMNAVDPHSPIALELSAEMMEAMDNYEGALVPLKKAIEIAPQRPGGHYNLGEAYRQLAEWEPAAEQFQAELKIDPSNCMAESALGGMLLSRSEKPDDALSHLERAISLCPRLTETRIDRARVLLKLARYDEAARDLQAAVLVDPDRAAAHFFLAKAYVALGRTQDSQSEMATFSLLDAKARAVTAEIASQASEIRRPKP
jgi:Tfp pilus assembly protein PilF